MGIDAAIKKKFTFIKPGLKAVITLLILLLINTPCIQAQENIECPQLTNKKADKVFDKAIRAYRVRNYSECIMNLNDVINIEPEYTDAYFLLGLIYIENSRQNLKEASNNFKRVIEICPTYDIYAYYNLARISYGAGEYEDAYNYITSFLEDVDLIKSDEDYQEAVSIQDYSRLYTELLNNPVPFDPKPVPGISTNEDEYLPIISPDNELALFTRKIKIPPRRDDITPQVKYKERFMVSSRINGNFHEGDFMPHPFNLNDNEGGATLTINNKELFYTLCKYAPGDSYYNCDICYSKKVNGKWSQIESIGDQINLKNTWESQPSITSDGKTLYFVSDRANGYGGYDIYKSTRNEEGIWGEAINLGPKINSAGNEKSPFIHTDSQTLYFSSEGLMGLGGYDIFFTKLNDDESWNIPTNIGYPINSFEDDVGFFVSTDGHYGYFASNKFQGQGGWDLYYFDLYEDARPEKVLFVRGTVKNQSVAGFANTRVELKNVQSKKVTDIPVDTLTGEYVAAVLFRNDYVLNVKQKGFVNESKYLSHVDPKFVEPISIAIDLKQIEVGMSYRLNDIYFAFNSYELAPESEAVIEEFYVFLNDNPSLKVRIEGHTDNIGNDNDNLQLSKKRSESVYNHLIKMGISTNRLEFRGYGESKPVASNSTEDGRARNRRTEFVIVEK